MIRADETFDGTFPYMPHFSHASGFPMHYVDEGPRDGKTILCLHGEPTWGYLFRHLIRALRDRYRVIVPDHMGFGKSATPPTRSYWLQDHIENLERFVLAQDLRDITLVMHDFGGPVGMGLAARHPDRIRAIVSVNGPTPFGQPDLGERLTANARISPWFQWIVKAHAQGRLEAVLGELEFNILSTLKLNGFENHDLIGDVWLQAYGSRFSSAAQCLGAIGWAKGFALGEHRFEVPGDAARRAIAVKPALAIWGMRDRTLNAEHFLPLFEAAFPGAAVRRLDTAGHYSLEDEPDSISTHIGSFLEQS
ncbi:alpha/beta hydrolase [Trinickia dabaoshanensis]|uniref:Alpha/beta hydrolase n=1 Tax=Trinickia dabaoshanensis TaxID=564714 RepID=A0A2N7VPD0_9BURK|nr:alpha/beta fold hydrolase [Trinickia dabaoshanensis]PMS19020.1 alpha/beta hydrolase [Trinickia dabaoshanensis]